MNYELRVQSYNGQWLVADTTGAVIAFTYQANDVAELKHRQANRSNNIKLPRTTTNDAIFGFSGEIRSAYDSAFRRLPCILTVDGVAISGEGSSVALTTVGETHYECTVLGSTFDFFKQLKTCNLRDCMVQYEAQTGLKLEGKGIPDIPKWNIDYVMQSYDIKGDYGNSPFAVMDWHKEERIPNHLSDGDWSRNLAPAINVGSLYPCVRLKKLLEIICHTQGYRLITDIDTDPRFLNTAIPCVSARPAKQTREQWHDYYQQTAPEVALRYGGVNYDFRKLNGECGKPSNKSLFSQEWNRLVYHAPVKGRYTFKVNFTTQGSLSHKVRLKVKQAGVFVLNVSSENKFDRNIKLQVDEDKSIEFILESSVAGASTCNLTDLKIEVVALEENLDTDVSVGKEFPVVQNLPDITQLDVFRLFVQMFGLTVHVNNLLGTVHCYTFNKVYENRTIARNWSDRLDSRLGDMEFHMDYAQKNIINYKEYESTALKGDKEHTILTQSTGYFSVDDHMLDPEKELFELDAVSCDEAAHFDVGYTAKIRLRQNNVPSGVGPFAVVHLDLREGEGMSFTLHEGAINQSTEKKTVSKVIYAEFWPLEAQTLIDTYYQKLTTQMLKHSRMITVQMLLTPLDVANFDHSIPIYLQKYNAYFYVNKIHNYRSDKLTKVDLVKL